MLANNLPDFFSRKSYENFTASPCGWFRYIQYNLTLRQVKNICKKLKIMFFRRQYIVNSYKLFFCMGSIDFFHDTSILFCWKINSCLIFWIITSHLCIPHIEVMRLNRCKHVQHGEYVVLRRHWLNNKPALVWLFWFAFFYFTPYQSQWVI